MKIQFLGSGGAFTIPEKDENFHSNVIVTVSEGSGEDQKISRLLIDAGSQIASSLYVAGYTVDDIDAIFITHNHDDHNGGLEYIGFKRYFTKTPRKPILNANPLVLQTLWQQVLQGNMAPTQGKRVDLTAYFEVNPVPPKRGFSFGGVDFFPVRLSHIIDDVEEVPAFGLVWSAEGIDFFFSGDASFDFWRLMPFWEAAHVIFQECEFANYENSVHTQYHQLQKIPDKYKEKMWLYHYSLNDRSFDELNQEVKKDGFAGLVKKGQEFDTDNMKEK